MLTNNQDEESKAVENLEVAGGICWRQRWRILTLPHRWDHWKATKYLMRYSIAFQWRSSLQLAKLRNQLWMCFHQKLKYFSETWILPFIVLLASLAYVVQAIAFYNSDDWFRFVCVCMISDHINITATISQQQFDSSTIIEQ